MEAFLHRLVGDEKETVRLSEEPTVIGRSRSSDLLLDDSAVSRAHARITQAEGTHVLEDLGSLHGTFLNGTRIEGPTQLKSTDRILICDHALIYHERESLEPDSTEARGLKLTEIVEEPHTMQVSVDATLSVKAHESEAGSKAKLRALLEIGSCLHSSLSEDEVLSGILDGLFRIFAQAERGFILVMGTEGELIPRASRGRSGESEDEVRISRTVVRQAFEQREAILSENRAPWREA